MKKREFGMKYLDINQGRFEGLSHKGLNAYDLIGSGGGIDSYTATCTYEVIGVWKYNGDPLRDFANTVHFYDKENDVTIAMTHIDKLFANHFVGKKFNSGDEIYKEGNTGYSKGNHIHLEIGKGKQEKKVKLTVNGIEASQLKDLINVEDYFYIELSETTIVKDGGYYWEKRHKFVPPTGVNENLSGCYMHATKMGFRVRSYAVSGNPKVLVPMGQKAEILEFIGIQSDGYQWVRVRYGAYEGYSQLDTKNCYTLSGACSKTLYLYAIKSAFRLRVSAPNGSQRALCPIGGKAKILYFGNISSDGYQWAYVEYNGVQGWSQMDTRNCYTVNV